MVRVLQILCALNDGGIERLLYEYYRRFNHQEIVFDFAINDTNEGILEKRLVDMGSNIYRYTKFRINFCQAVKDLNNIIDNEDYDIIHSHLANRGVFSIIHAKKKGIKTRISHCHSAFEPESFVEKSFRKLSTPLTKVYSTHLFACGNDSGKWMWGKKNIENNRVIIMKNAINVNKFKFSDSKRKKIRNELNIEGKFVLGCVGRLSYQKNQEFLIDVFKKYNESHPNSCLILIGEGDKREAIKNKIEKYDLEDSVILLGVRDNVNELLSAFDIYILPSLYEGLPISVIEAQASGLNCILSNRITQEVALSSLVDYCKIDGTLNEWCLAIDRSKDKILKDRSKAVKVINDNGYNIDIESKKLYEFYKYI